jgi:hypothetical protein
VDSEKRESNGRNERENDSRENLQLSHIDTENIIKSFNIKYHIIKEKRMSIRIYQLKGSADGGTSMFHTIIIITKMFRISLIFIVSTHIGKDTILKIFKH